MAELTEYNSKYNILQLFQEKFGEDKYRIIARRLQKELGIFDAHHIDYTLSFNPLCTRYFIKSILLEIKLQYLDYYLYIFISESYPFERPLLKMDKFSISDRKYRVQDGLEDTPIHHLHSYISDFVLNTSETDLICIKEFIEKYYVKPKNMNDYDIDSFRVYWQKYENCKSPALLLYDYYQLMCEGIHLAIHSC